MTELIVAVNEDFVRRAFDNVKARSTEPTLTDATLYSASSAIKAAVGETWLKIEKVVGESLRMRWEVVQGTVQNVVDYVAVTANSLGNQAILYREILVDKLRAVISSTFDLALASLRTHIKVGELSYRLKTIELQQKLVFSGSVEASLTTLCKFMSSGELIIQGAYEESSSL